jgi:hypothetical protein
MPRHWTEQEHRQHSFRHFRLPEEKRAATVAALHQSALPNASAIAGQLGVSHFFVCTVARAEGVRLRPGRRPAGDAGPISRR